jgi:expansin (peptidoglycan-binding protein)
MFDGWPGANGNPNQNPICGRQAQITSGGKSIVVTVTDRCEGCAYGDFDLSPSAFNALQDFGVGRTGCTYQFL